MSERVCTYVIIRLHNIKPRFWLSNFLKKKTTIFRQVWLSGRFTTVGETQLWEWTEDEVIQLVLPLTSVLLSLHNCESLCVSMYANTRQQWTKTSTSSLFSALKFAEKRHCFFKISLAVIRDSVHCWGEQKASWELIYGGRRPVAHMITGPAAVQAAE